ncbi:cytochrome c [Marivirga salinae]|uniref:Cytochrome c n=1 Tax=Marivirga salinarum TaxID=3059078 RepID=A0AA51NCA4_9BACT|nr:cytochrome c [Marivirga sp. BDSF4-3]WMN12488.1 cytochrome c [Marivirga sp. BDSF4-3]
MEIGMLHSHVLVVTLFLLFLLFKTVLLLVNKKEFLTKIRTKLKMVDPILGVLMLATGGYLLSLYGSAAPTYLWVKLVLVLIIIPIGIVAFKKENKAMAVIALLLTFYIYGASEVGSLTFSKDESVAVSDDSPANNAAEVVIEGETTELVKNGKEIYLAECKKCHGEDGKKGLFKAPDLTQSQLDLSERVAWIKIGKGVMPAYENELSETEIEAVALYLDELK